MNDQFDNYNILNNIRNDERFFIQEGPNKSFSKKLTEEEYTQEIIKDSLNRFEIAPVDEVKSSQEYLESILKIKLKFERYIKDYLRECVRPIEKPYDFKKIKKDLDLFELQLNEINIQIEKRKAIILLQNDYEIKKKIKPMT